MLTKKDLHRVIDELNEEQVQKVIQIVEVIQGGPTRTHDTVNLARYSGVLQLREDPLAYQEHIRNEWP
jgi:hypothetical protein